MIRKMLVPLLCLFVFTAFFPIIESEHCFYPARKAEILPSLPRRAGVFNKIPRTAESGKRGRALAKPGQAWPEKGAGHGLPTLREPWHRAGGYLVSSSATLH